MERNSANEYKEESAAMPLTDREVQIARIMTYERMLEEATALLRSKAERERLAELVNALSAYYESPLWKQDFFDDEAGKLPRDLKRGVLSEDGIYDLLSRYDEKADEKEETESACSFAPAQD